MNQEKKYVCPSCGKKFSNKQRYGGHRAWCEVPKEERSRIMSKRIQTAWDTGKKTQEKFTGGEEYQYEKGHVPWNKGKSCPSLSLKYIEKEKWIKKRGKWRPRKSKALSYLIGVLIGDGSVSVIKPKKHSQKSYRIHLAVTDKNFAMSFKRSLEKIGIKNVRKYYYSGEEEQHRGMYHVFAACMLFVKWFQQLNLQDIRSEIESYKRPFIRGFYESEGSLTINSGNNESLVVSMCNRDKKILRFVLKLVRELHFPFYWRKNEREDGIDYQIRLFKQEEVSRFLEEVNPCIKTTPRSVS